jgi:hypothetical protein
MRTLNMQGMKLFRAPALAAVVLGGSMILVGASSAQAHDRDDCRRTVDRAERKLNREIERHGYYSRQANHQRHELQEARERCWTERLEWRDGHRD